MLRSAFPARVALDADIVWRVGEDARGLLVAKQRFIGPRVECVAAQDAMVIQKPQVAKLGYGWPRGGFKFVCGVRVRQLQRLNVQIDLRSLETRRLDLKIEGDFGKLLQNDRDLAIVPRRPVGQLVVGEHIGFGLRVGQMLEADDGHAFKPEPLRGLKAAMAHDDSVHAVDQDRCSEAECFDTASDRHYLLATMNSRIKWMSCQRIHGHMGEGAASRLCRVLSR